MPPRVQRFQDLEVYKKAFEVADRIYQLSKSFPREEAYSLTDQVRRASRSVGAQIAEAWGNRRYDRYFVSRLVGADSEQLEVQHWIQTAAACGYLTESQAKELVTQLAEIGRMLQSMIDKAHSFRPIGKPTH